MEDHFTCVLNERIRRTDKYETFSYLAIFDGHRSEDASLFCAKHLLDHLVKCETKRINLIENIAKIKSPIFSSNYKIKKMFLDFDEILERKANMKIVKESSGCTAINIIIKKGEDKNELEIICANVGDSRAILYDEKLKILSIDHKPYRLTEENRILASKTSIVKGRISSVLALSRSFGDFDFKKKTNLNRNEQCIIAEPEIKRFVVRNNKRSFKFIVLASDGLLDVLSNEAISEFVLLRLKEQKNGSYLKKREKFLSEMNLPSFKIKDKIQQTKKEMKRRNSNFNTRAIAEDLVLLSLKKKSKDNVTAIVILLFPN